MRAEAGDPNLSEEDAEEAFRNLPTRKTVGKVKATGLSINQGTGEILGLAEPIERDPYETVDGKGEYEIYGQTGSVFSGVQIHISRFKQARTFCFY
jgi:hypothetical protein